MSDRPTPEQIMMNHSISATGLGEVACRCNETGWISWTDFHRHVLGQFAEHGYVIVHPDDVPVNPISEGEWAIRVGLFGWNGCRRHIFGDNA